MVPPSMRRRFASPVGALMLSLAPGLAFGQRGVPLVRGMEVDGKAMRDSLDAPFWRALAASPCPPVAWSTNFASQDAFSVATAPLRARLQRSVGSLYDRAGNVLSRTYVYRSPRYTIERIAYSSRIPSASLVGWLATPIGSESASAPVVLLHGSGMAPQEAFNWQFADQYTGNFFTRLDSTAFVGSAIELVEAGYTVFVPWISDDKLADFWPRVPWEYVGRAGALLSAKLNGPGANLLLSNEVSSAIDLLQQEKGVDSTKLSIMGWGEGAQLASVSAALDKRVTAVVRMDATVDRRALRATVSGMFSESSFTHIDCALGDVEMAALTAPRPLLYAYATSDPSVSRYAAFLSPRVVPSRIRSMYAALGAPRAFGVMKDSIWTSDSMRRVRMWLDSAVGFHPRAMAAKPGYPSKPSTQRYHSEYMDSTLFLRAAYIAQLGPCVSPTVTPNYTSRGAYDSSVAPLRKFVATQLRVPALDVPSTLRVLRRDTVLRQPKYLLEYVEIASSRIPMPIVGMLATPYTTTTQSPAVISVDANYGFVAVFGLKGRERTPYLNAYGDYLASNGTVVFAPYIPTLFPEVAPTELRAKDPTGLSGWSFLIPYYAGAVDFALSLPQVDSTRIGMWGISFAGYPALITTALDKRVSALLFSNPIATADVLFQSQDAALLAPWFGSICSVIDPALTYLIAPRRLVRENGAHDSNGYEHFPLESIERIRHVYSLLGIPAQFEFVRHAGGHETLPRLLF